MSESTPAYYPPGWDRERMLNSAANNDREGLTEENMASFRSGLRADIGDRAYEQFFKEMYRRELAADESASVQAGPAIREPPFMEIMRLREERVSREPPWNPWGFVIFKSPEIRDSDQWTECKKSFEQIVHDSIRQCRGCPGLDVYLSRMHFQWVEDVPEAEASMQLISQRAIRDGLIKAEMTMWSQHPTPGLNHSLVLYITPQSLNSIMNSELPAATHRRHRKDIPFVVAISTAASAVDETEDDPVQGAEDDNEEEDDEEFVWRGYFNVAVETLMTSLFPAIADDSLEPFEIGGHVTSDDIWCDTTRWGVHKAGVGHWDSVTQQPSEDL